MTLRKTSPVMVTIVVIVVGWTWGDATGSRQPAVQEENAATAAEHQPTDIAVINVTRIFQNHGEFKRRLELIRREMKDFEGQLAVRQAEIDSVTRRLQAARPGSPERDKTQLLLARLQTELKLLSDRQRQQFAKQEALLYSDTYTEITEAVRKHAQANGLRLVLRAHDEPIDPNNPKSVLGAVNRLVVYQEGLDITDDILKRLNVEKNGASPT